MSQGNYTRFRRATLDFATRPRFGYDWFCAAIDAVQKSHDGRMDWLDFEAMLVDILKSDKLTPEQMCQFTREAIDTYTRRGHFTPHLRRRREGMMSNCSTCGEPQDVFRRLVLTDADGVVVDQGEYCLDCWRSMAEQIMRYAELRDNQIPEEEPPPPPLPDPKGRTTAAVLSDVIEEHRERLARAISDSMDGYFHRG